MFFSLVIKKHLHYISYTVHNNLHQLSALTQINMNSQIMRIMFQKKNKQKNRPPGNFHSLHIHVDLLSQKILGQLQNIAHISVSLITRQPLPFNLFKAPSTVLSFSFVPSTLLNELPYSTTLKHRRRRKNSGTGSLQLQSSAFPPTDTDKMQISMISGD